MIIGYWQQNSYWRTSKKITNVVTIITKSGEMENQRTKNQMTRTKKNPIDRDAISDFLFSDLFVPPAGGIGS
jgi:hypothetical protein